MNGSRPNDNVFFYDGAVATRTRSNGTSIGAADVDAVQEVQILTANYAAEYGRSGGGQVRVITKSGGRDFHGTAYEFFRNSAMDANTWARNISPFSFQNSIPQPLKYNQFGWGVKDRCTSQEVQYGPQQTVLPVQPGMAALSHYPDQHRHRALAENAARAISANCWGRIFSSAGSYNVVDPTTGAPFPDNIIPASRLSPNGLALMKAYPLPAGIRAGKPELHRVQRRDRQHPQGLHFARRAAHAEGHHPAAGAELQLSTWPTPSRAPSRWPPTSWTVPTRPAR